MGWQGFRFLCVCVCVCVTRNLVTADPVKSVKPKLNLN